MLTSSGGDIEFEPPISKLHRLTNSICVMIAGDVSLQAEIMQAVIQQVDSDSNRSWGIGEVAELYFDSLEAIRRRRAERALLHPLGMDLAAIREVHSDLALRLSSDLLNFQLAPVEALITGIDSSGAHIYQITNEGTTCQDWVAFASIGIGQGHANSSLMFSGHSRAREVPETMFAVYAAKKRAEVAPGVGKATDMFLIEPGELNYFPVYQNVLDELEQCYDEVQISAEKARNHANRRIYDFVKNLIESNTAAANEQHEIQQHQVPTRADETEPAAAEEPGEGLESA